MLSKPVSTSRRSRASHHNDRSIADQTCSPGRWVLANPWVHRVACLLAFAWTIGYLTSPLWPTSVMPLDSDANGPRALMLLVPDEVLEGWFLGPVTWAGLWQRLTVTFVAGLILAVAGCCGHWLLMAVKLPVVTQRSEQLVFAVVIGLSYLATITLLVGLAGAIGKAYSAVLTITTAILLAKAAAWGRWAFSTDDSQAAETSLARERISQRLASDETVTPPPQVKGVLDWLMIVLICGITLLLWARAVMPPVEFDVREYHLQAPKEWSQAGRITFLPHNIYANMPMATEMHALLAIDLWRLSGRPDSWRWGGISGKLVMASFAFWTAVLCGFAVRRLTQCPTFGLLITAAVLAMPALMQGAVTGFVEPAVACFFAAGLLLLVLLPSGQPRGSLNQGHAWFWFGFLAGSAVAAKYPALLFISLPLLVACWWLTRTHQWRLHWRPVGLFCVAFAITAGPWFCKNIVLAGNPVYPLAAKWLGGKTMTTEKIEQWNRAHAPGPVNLRALPSGLDSFSWRWYLQSPLLPQLAILAALGAWRNTEVRVLCAALFVSWLAWWLLTHRVERFLVPSLPLLFLLAGVGLHVCKTLIGKPLTVLLALALLWLNTIMIAGPLLGDSRLGVDLAALYPGLPDAIPAANEQHLQFLGKHLQPSDYLLLVGDAAAFHYPVDVQYATAFDALPLTEITENLPRERWREAFQQRGWTHVLVHWGEVIRLQQSYGYDANVTPSLFSELIDAGVLKLMRDDLSMGIVRLYEVR